MENAKNILDTFKPSDIDILMMLINSVEASRPKLSNKLLKEFKDEYEKYIGLNFSEAYLKSVRLSLNHLLAFLGDEAILSDFNVKQADEFISFLKTKANRGFRVYYRNLKAAFTKAKDWGYINENPFVKIRLPKANDLKPATISKEQLDAILSHIQSLVIKNIIEFTFYNGC
jgi:site-specific recombinase XerD